MLSWSTLITDCTNSKHSLPYEKPDVDDPYSRPWSINISVPTRFLNTFIPRGSCVSSLETLCRRVILEHFYFSELLPRSESEESIKKSSLRNWYVSNTKVQLKRIKFSKKYEGFKKNLKSI